MVQLQKETAKLVLTPNPGVNILLQLFMAGTLTNLLEDFPALLFKEFLY
jgi:hypothetical protein